MSTAVGAREPFLLGDWRIEPDVCEVSRGEERRHLEPRTMAVLCHLAARSGATVSRDELFDSVWKTRYVGDDALTRAISQLRQALDDDPRSPRFVQTVPKLGYRLLIVPTVLEKADVPSGPVAPAALSPESDASASLQATDTVAAPVMQSRTTFGSHRRLFVAALAAATVLLGTWLYLDFRRSSTDATNPSASGSLSLLPISAQSVAILPFVTMDTDAGSVTFADGMAEEIIQMLARVPGLRVPSRTSSFHFRDRAVSVRVIGRELGVAHVLEGSIRRDADRVRVTAQLIDARTDEHSWSESYDRKLEDIFGIQQEIATAIAQRLRVSLGDELADRRPMTTDLVAYQLYIDAHLNRDSGRGPQQTIDMYKAAVERDPKFAVAWAQLGSAYWTAPGYVDMSRAEIAAFDRAAQEASEHALMLDDTSSLAHSTLADIDHSARRYSAAEARHRRALASLPGARTTHVGYAAMLGEVGRARDAVKHMQIGWRLDPLSADIAFRLARAHLLAGNIDDARSAMDLARRLGFQGAVLDHMEGYLKARAGDYRGATLAWTRGADPAESQVMRAVFAALEDPSQRSIAIAAVRALPAWHPLPYRGRFFAACLLGDAELAWQAANEGVESGLEPTDNWWLEEAKILRADPRFQELAEKMQYVAYWREYGLPDKCQFEGGKLRCT